MGRPDPRRQMSHVEPVFAMMERVSESDRHYVPDPTPTRGNRTIKSATYPLL